MQASLALINRLILTLLFVAASGQAAMSAEDIALTYGCARPLRVGIEEFGAMYSAGAGVDSDILRELSRRSGCCFEIRNLLRAEMWPAMAAGEIDMATSSISMAVKAPVGASLLVQSVTQDAVGTRWANTSTMTSRTGCSKRGSCPTIAKIHGPEHGSRWHRSKKAWR